MMPALACALLSYRDEPYLVAAVRSLLDQDVPVEVVVVNSGGGDPADRLDAAGIHVPVWSFSHRLYPGAARNVGIDRTHAPFMSFLAADCVAAAGWASARLRAHDAGAAAVASAMTNAYPASPTAWAALLLRHNRRLAVTPPGDRLYYGVSYARSLFERFGRFREDLRAGEDTEFNARFRGHARTAFALDAVTAHRYPTDLGALLLDAFRRGNLQARMQGQIRGRRPEALRVALGGPRNAARALTVAARSGPRERGMMLRAWPLVVASALTHSAGAISAILRACAD
jgi:glycosyltransferase involved in cell wall biosynthesis